MSEEPIYNTNTVNNMFDVVVLVGPDDREIIKTQIEFTKKNIIGYRKIFLICYDPTIEMDGCITINEKIFPFTIDTVASFHDKLKRNKLYLEQLSKIGKLDRNGWYLQQLLKLYAGIVIPNILDKYLVVDCDTFFLKPTTFIENNKCLYNYGMEYHRPYFIHMHKLMKLTKSSPYSGICHHMIFETKYINEIINIVEKTHGDYFYNVFLKLIDETTVNTLSGASEYEIYFNYMLTYHSENIVIRKLEWANTSIFNKTIEDDFTNIPFDYVSYHWYSR
jgi:hypothetical protein